MITVNIKNAEYEIVTEKGALSHIEDYINLNRNIMVVTDSNIPKSYVDAVLSKSKNGFVYTINPGEKSKTLDSFRAILEFMLEKGFVRSDAVVAVGGGVVGDLAGFVAASYMRGIDFYNIPTTVLSQLDSSIGGKVAVNLNSIKNIIGAFYQPKKVIIDRNTLNSLDKRQIANGLAEGIKMGLTSDSSLFEIFEADNYLDRLDEIIEKSLMVKKAVVEEDEKETGLRKILNFGHTAGHGVESVASGELYHGECVALGMLYMSGDEVKERLVPVLKRVGLPTSHSYDTEKIISAMMHDKKLKGDTISVVTVNKVGNGEIKDISTNGLIEKVRMYK